MANPDGDAVLHLSDAAVVGGIIYVTDVAITLTVQTQLIDPVTKQFQTETKALLNVSPRNVFNAWKIASLGISERIQPMPPQYHGAAAAEDASMQVMTSIRRKGRRARLHAVPDGGAVGAGRVDDVPGADRDVVDSRNYQHDVAGAVRR